MNQPHLLSKLFGLPIRYLLLIALPLLIILSTTLDTEGIVLPAGTASDASSPAIIAAPSDDVEVSYTATGFTPTFLSVPIGTRVRFVNMTATALWVAADPEPSHSDYPDFDAGRDYMKGDTYVFQFNRAGTFGYDNHKNVTDHAFIQVVDPSHEALSVDTVVPAQRVRRDTLLKLFKPGDQESIFAVFDAIKSDPSLSNDCHELAHDLGGRAYDLYGFTAAMTFNSTDRANHLSVETVCAGGYMHGVLEELFIHQPELKDEPARMCTGVSEGNKPSCFHGVGHALMFVNKRAIISSLTGCRLLPRAADAARCFEGVWMELFWGSTEHSGPRTLNWDLAAPLDPCIETPQDSKPACFLYAPFGYLRAHPQDYVGAGALCSSSNLAESDAAMCIEGVGITMMSHFKGQHLERAEPLAAGLDTTMKYGFYRGVIGYAYFSGISRPDLAATCASLQNDTAVCMSALSNIKS